MKIYRGPKGKKFRYANTELVKIAGDEYHQFVDSVDLSDHISS